MLKSKSAKAGFTLIELLVVIAIIGTLANVVLASLNSAREDARYAAAQSELREMSRAIVATQIESRQLLLQITGSGCSGCACREGEVNGGIDSARCANNWQAARSAITAATGGANSIGDITDFETDPWGSPYFLDENEGEFSATPCRNDILRSAGADRAFGTAYDVTILLPFNLPPCS